jgi:hypothetical protein
MTAIEEFFATFRPNRQEYVRRDSEKTITAPLTAKVVQEHFDGKIVVAFKAAGVERDYVGVDVDDHEGGPWLNKMLVAGYSKITEKYEEVVRRMGGKEPSVVFRSPRGLHAYWFMDRSLPSLLLDEVMKERFEDRFAENLPTNQAALRVPRPQDYLGDNLRPREFAGYEGMRRYAPEAIFGEEIRPEVRRAKSSAGGVGTVKGGGKGKEAKTPAKKERDPMKNIEDAEAYYGPFKNFQTNEPFKKLVGKYFANGLNEEQAIARFRAILDRSPEYTRDLRSELEPRVASAYRNLKKPNNLAGIKHALIRGDADAMKVVQTIIEATGMKETDKEYKRLEEFILCLWGRKIELDWIGKDPERAAFHEFLYPGFLRLFRQGYYPINSKELHGWYSEYHRYLRLLKGIGVMTECKYGYSTILGRCKHYVLNINMFKNLHGNVVQLTGSLTFEKVGTSEPDNVHGGGAPAPSVSA